MQTKIKLRPWSINDLDNLVKFGNNPAIAKNMTDQFPSPYTIEKGKNFISMAISAQPYHILAIDNEGQAIGGIGLQLQQDIQRMNAEMGYWLAEPFWGKGIITDAIKNMVSYGFSTWPINRIYARPFGHNIASQKALEKAGFKLEATFKSTLFKNDEYVDELVYAIRR